MTVKELKEMEGYEFECNITDDMASELSNCRYELFDEWGAAFVRIGKDCDIGAEYNLCVDDTTKENINCSAIYYMEMNNKTGYLSTDTSLFEHYEIDFSNPNWKEELENAMCEALIKFMYVPAFEEKQKESIPEKETKKIYAYENYFGDKGFIIANSYEEAKEKYLNKYPKRKIFDGSDYLEEYDAFLFESSELKETNDLYCLFPY